jgi:hypothetical protein
MEVVKNAQQQQTALEERSLSTTRGKHCSRTRNHTKVPINSVSDERHAMTRDAMCGWKTQVVETDTQKNAGLF